MFLDAVILVLKKLLGHLPISFFLRSSSFFPLFFEVVFHFFLGPLSSWVKIRLHTKNQLPRLPGSALKVPGWVGGGGWWVPTHYQVKHQLMLRLSWAVTTVFLLIRNFL